VAAIALGGAAAAAAGVAGGLAWLGKRLIGKK
jgi:hypothetical protein